MASSRPKRNVIIGGILLHLSLGTLYSWGCVQPYVTSYVRLYHPTVTIKDTTIIYGCACLGHSLTSPFVGLPQDKRRLGLRRTAAVGATLVALATLASSMATSVVGLAVLNAFFGVGIGLAYTCPLVSGYAWMPDRKGTVTGFVVAGFGAGAAVFDAVATAVVNPQNAPADAATGFYGEEVAGRVPLMYIVLGSCYLVLGLFGSWMIMNHPTDSSSSSSSSRKEGSSGSYTILSSSLDDSSGNSNSNSSSTRRRKNGSPLLGKVELDDRHCCYEDDHYDDDDDHDEDASKPIGNTGCEAPPPRPSPLRRKILATTENGHDDHQDESRQQRQQRQRQQQQQHQHQPVEGQDQPQQEFDVPQGRARSSTAATDPFSPVITTVDSDDGREGARGGGGYAPVHRKTQLQPQRHKLVDFGLDSSNTMDSCLPTVAAAAADVGGTKGDWARRDVGVRASAAGAREGQDGPQLEAWRLLAEFDFYHLALTMLCTCVSGLYIAGNYKGIARDIFPGADRFLSILGSVASLCNAAGRIVGGLSVDRFGCFATLLAQAGSTTCLLLTLRVVQADRASFFLAICLMHALYGSNFALYPTLTAEFFGAATAGSNYGLVFMFFGIGSFLAMLWLAAMTQTSGQVFLAGAGVSFAGAASAAMLWARRSRRKLTRSGSARSASATTVDAPC
ncbi:unnamed protein product [Pylaiella littoralis]